MQESADIKNILKNPPDAEKLSTVFYFLGISFVFLGLLSLILPHLKILEELPFTIPGLFPYLLFGILLLSGILCFISSKMLKNHEPRGVTIGIAAMMVFDSSLIILAILDLLIKNSPEQKDMLFFYLLVVSFVLGFPSSLLLFYLQRLKIFLLSSSRDGIDLK